MTTACVSWELDEAGRTKAHAYPACTNAPHIALCGRTLPTFAEPVTFGFIPPESVCARCFRATEAHAKECRRLAA